MLEKLIRDTGFNCLIKGRYGYILFNKNDTYVGRAFEKYGEFSENEVALFRQICTRGDIVIDIGANIGAHTLAFSEFVGSTGRVYAYEPQRIVFQTLCANMAINSIQNVECCQMAVADKKGMIRIPDIRYDLPANHGGFQVKEAQTGIKTPIISIDDVFETPRLKLIKIDVEGMETQVISGARQTIGRFKPFLYVENDQVEKSRGLIETIQALDYRLFWHLPPLFNPDNFAKDPENIFQGIVSFNMLCFHRSLDLNLDGFQEIIDSAEHPLKNADTI